MSAVNAASVFCARAVMAIPMFPTTGTLRFLPRGNAAQRFSELQLPCVEEKNIAGHKPELKILHTSVLVTGGETRWVCIKSRQKCRASVAAESSSWHCIVVGSATSASFCHSAHQYP